MDKNVLITGASGGIGYELALVFARNNYDLILTARNQAMLQKIKTEIESDYSVNVKIISGDLSTHDFPQQLADILSTENISVEILVNNAGFGDYGLFYESDLVKQQEMINLNILALTKLTRLFLPEMVKNKKGRILNLASVAAFIPGPFMSVYYATKAYVLSFTFAIANELKGTGVTVTALCPGPTQSNFSKAASVDGSKLFNSKIPSAASVAAFGYKALMQGKTAAVHGFSNKLNVFFAGLAPRKMAAAMTRKIQEIK